MSGIQRLLKMLQSDNADTRFDACEQLKVESSIPDEAITALQDATLDTDRYVADAASRALAVHTILTASRPEAAQGDSASPPESPSQRGTTVWQAIGVGAVVGFGIPFILYYMGWFVNEAKYSTLFELIENMASLLVPSTIGIPFGIIGALIGRRTGTKRAVWLGGILGVSLAIIPVVCLLLLWLMLGSLVA